MQLTRSLSAIVLLGAALAGGLARPAAANTAEAAARVTMFDEPSSKNIGVRVLPTPRRMPVATLCTPSKS